MIMSSLKSQGVSRLVLKGVKDRDIYVELLTRIESKVKKLVTQERNVQEIFHDQDSWELIKLVTRHIRKFTRDMTVSGDVTLFYRQANQDLVGFKEPHRDMPEASSTSFEEDGHPGSCVAWVSVTDADVENSCLQYLPKENDRYYYQPGMNCTEAIGEQELRTIPTKKGDVVLISNRVIHCGTVPARKSSKCRIALSFVLVSKSMNPCLEPFFKHLPRTQQERVFIQRILSIYYQEQLRTKNIESLKTWLSKQEIFYDMCHQRMLKKILCDLLN